MDEPEIDNSMETFMTLFNKMFTETKYNLQALNKRMESMDKCFNNVLLLSSDKPFDEVNPDKEEQNDQNNENINSDNFDNNNNYKNKKNKKQKGKMTSKDLDEIEKMFKDIDEPNDNYNTFFIGKKRNNKKNTVAPTDLDPKNYYHDIQELLKNYSLDNDNDEKDKTNINTIKNKKEIKNDENKKKGKRGRKKKIIDDKNVTSESNADVDYLVPEKNDGYSKFKEFKELKKKMNNKQYSKYSDEEEIDDDLDSDF